MDIHSQKDVKSSKKSLSYLYLALYLSLSVLDLSTALAMEPPCQYIALSKQFLSVALTRHKDTIPVNVPRCR